MLTFMRKHARSWFIKVLLGTVILVFIFFYGFNLRQRRAELLASVNGINIGIREFLRQYERLRDLQQDMGVQPTAEQIRALKETTLNNLINRVLLMDEADKWKLLVTENEIKQYIQSISAFREKGQFSLERFQMFLRSRGISEGEFVEELRQALLAEKMENLVGDCAVVTEEELSAIYHLFYDKVVVNYVELEPEKFQKRFSPSASELETYFKENIASYRIPEKVEVVYLHVDPKDLLKEVKVDEEEIKARYKSTLDRWKQSKRALVRHILIRTTEKDDPKTRMKALQRAEEIIRRLEKGQDFAKLAKKYSQDPQSASKGGSLGWVLPGQLPDDLDRAIFQELSPGDISKKPIKSPQGFHVVRLEKLQAERVQPLEEVRKTILKELKEEKAKGRASDLANSVYLFIFRGGTFEEAAKEFSLKARKSPPFSLREDVKGLPGGVRFKEAAFSLKKPGDFSEVVEDEGGYYILQLVARHPSRDPQFKEVKDKVKADLIRIRAAEAARKEAQLALEKIKSKGERSLEKWAASKGLKVQTSPPLGRVFHFGILPSDLVEDAFSMPEGRNLLPKVYFDGNNYLIAWVKDRMPADPKTFKEKGKSLRAMLLRERREWLLREWLDMLHSRAEINIYQQY
jgi:peptidyl-prolyl cis-trans isomerase D